MKIILSQIGVVILFLLIDTVAFFYLFEEAGSLFIRQITVAFLCAAFSPLPMSTFPLLILLYLSWMIKDKNIFLFVYLILCLAVLLVPLVLLLIRHGHDAGISDIEDLEIIVFIGKETILMVDLLFLRRLKPVKFQY